MKKDSVEDLAIFAKLMKALAEEFGGSLSTDNIKIRFNVLSEYSIEQIKDATTTIIKARAATFPAVPTTKELIDAIESRIAPTISIENKAVIQADIVLEKLKFYGRNAKIDFEDPITFHLMTKQWPYSSWAAEVMTNQLTWWKKEFIAAYSAYGQRDIEEAKLIDFQASKDVLELSNKIGTKF